MSSSAPPTSPTAGLVARLPLRVLLVEDDPAFASVVRSMLAEAAPDVEVEHAGRLSAALAQIVRSQFGVIVTDLSLPDSDGPETVRHLLRAAPDVPLVVLSGVADMQVAIDVIHEGADDFVVKGALDADSVARLVRVAAERSKRMAYAHRPTGEADEATLLAVGTQLSELVRRHGLYLGLVIVRAEVHAGRPGFHLSRLMQAMEVLRRTIRRCDFIGRSAEAELAVVMVSRSPEIYPAVRRLEATLAAAVGTDVEIGFAANDPNRPVPFAMLVEQAREVVGPAHPISLEEEQL